MASIHFQLRRRIRVAGINDVARRSGVAASTLSDWVNATSRAGRRDRRLNDSQLERVARAVGCKLVVVSK
tara:strand:+ start:7169 stop:7378 length:210 start_codon:yes stop_codon:yes gene_type:complete